MTIGPGKTVVIPFTVTPWEQGLFSQDVRLFLDDGYLRQVDVSVTGNAIGELPTASN